MCLCGLSCDEIDFFFGTIESIGRGQCNVPEYDGKLF